MQRLANHDHATKELRQRQILSLVRRGRIASQEELAERLHERGIETTQPSLSRDLRELGILKLGGRYVAPEPVAAPAATSPRLELARFLRGVRPAGPHLTVVLTAVGTAQTVALAIDGAAWPEVVGTIAGDDTIFIATAGARDQQVVRERLEAYIKEGQHRA